MKNNEPLNCMHDNLEEEEEEKLISSKVNSNMECVIPSNIYGDNLSIYSIRIRMDGRIKSFRFHCGTESLLEDVGIQLWAGSLLLSDFVLHHKVVLIFLSDGIEYLLKNISH